MSDREELIELLWQTAVADRVRDGKDLKNAPVVRSKVEEMADVIIAAGFQKVTLEADMLATAYDRAWRDVTGITPDVNPYRTAK